jgi:hypothetical protein
VGGWGGGMGRELCTFVCTRPGPLPPLPPGGARVGVGMCTCVCLLGVFLVEGDGEAGEGVMGWGGGGKRVAWGCGGVGDNWNGSSDVRARPCVFCLPCIVCPQCCYACFPSAGGCSRTRWAACGARWTLC